MNVRFADEIINCRSVNCMPSKFKLGDILVGPNGILLKVVTVQKDCPIWESTHRTKCAVVFELQDRTIVPVPEMHGQYNVLRPKKAA